MKLQPSKDVRRFRNRDYPHIQGFLLRPSDTKMLYGCDACGKAQYFNRIGTPEDKTAIDKFIEQHVACEDGVLDAEEIE